MDLSYIPKQILYFRSYPDILYKTLEYKGQFTSEVEYLWMLRNDESDLAFDYLIIPDGCIDIIIDVSILERPEVFVSKPFIKATRVKLHGKFNYIGIRIKPGKVLKFLDFFPSEIKDDFKYLNNLDDFISKVKEKSLDINLVAELLLAYLYNKPKPNNIYKLIAELEKDSNNIAKYSDRHSRRLYKLITGFSPKSMSKVIKANQNIDDSNRFYKDYFDQSHFIKAFKEATGLTPKEFFKEYKV